MTWRIYYGDGKTYEGDPFSALGHNVQVIGVYDGPTVKLVRGKDFYVWLGGSWVGMDWTGVVTNYYNRPGPQKVIVGATMPDGDEYWKLCKRALKERP